MALQFVDGFGQYEGQVGSQLLSSLAASGYQCSPGIVLETGRHAGTYCLELQVSAGSAGLSWSSRVNGAKSILRAIAYGGGRWVTVGENGVIYTSTDTLTWVPCANTSSAHLYGVAYGDGMWVAVGAAATILSSADGVNWVARTSPNPAMVALAVAWADDRWVAVGSDGGAGAIITSINGTTWGSITDGVGSVPNNCLIHTGTHWVAGGNAGQVRRSADGITWTGGTFGSSSNAIGAMAYNGTTLVAVAGVTVRTSADHGATWASSTALPGADTANGLAWADGLWVAVGNGEKIYTSVDLVTWTLRDSPLPGSPALRAVSVGGGATVAWIAVGDVHGTTPNNMAAIAVSMAPPTTVARTFSSSAQRVVIGFAHQATSRGLIASIAGVGNIEWPAGIVINGVSGLAVPIRNHWYYYELTIDKGLNTMTLHINDTLDITISPLPSGVAALTSYVVTWQVENGAVGQLGDIYFLDSSTAGGATLVNRLKPIRIATRLPDADHTIEWGGEPDDMDHWQIVGLPPPDPARFIYSATSGAQDLFTSAAELPEDAGTSEMPIIAVAITALAAKSDLDNRQLGLAVGSGGSQLEVIDDTLTVDPSYSQGIFEQAPGATAWTPANIVSTPFGVIVRP